MLPRVKEPRHDRTLGNLQALGDFGVRTILDFPQDEHLALFRLESRDGAPQVLRQIAALGQRGWISLVAEGGDLNIFGGR